jgi:hypothetical protein
LTAYGQIALQHDELGMAMEILTPLYEIAGEPRQAYHLAKIYHARSQQAVSESVALDNCNHAIELAQQALKSDRHHVHATVLLQTLEEEHARLVASQLTDIAQHADQPGDTEDMTELQMNLVAALPLSRPNSQAANDTPPDGENRCNRRRSFWSRLKHKWLPKLRS